MADDMRAYKNLETTKSQAVKEAEQGNNGSVDTAKGSADFKGSYAESLAESKRKES